MFWRHILTADSRSSIYDLVRVITLVAFLTALAFTLWECFFIEVFGMGERERFDVLKFGQGVGLILAAGGGAMWARNDKESRDEPKEDARG
jgi:hypothetical protein